MKVLYPTIKIRGWSLFMASALALGVLILILVTNSPAYAIDENGCLTCHGNPDLKKVNGSGETISLYVNEERANTAAHRYLDCTQCHGSMVAAHTSGTQLNKLSTAELCGTCHKYEYAQHLQSIHGQQLLLGNNDVATCVDCHSNEGNPHSVIRTLEYNAPTFKKNIANTCAKCHAQPELMANYGVVETVYESYMRSFHGKAMELGTYKATELDKATCTNCHGVHDIKAITDPASPVAGLDNLTKTCESCHPGAGVKFAESFLGHRETSPQNNPVVHYTEIFFKYLLFSVIAFGIIVMLLAVRKYISNKWREIE